MIIRSFFVLKWNVYVLVKNLLFMSFVLEVYKYF
jgi:hypothetical protein